MTWDFFLDALHDTRRELRFRIQELPSDKLANKPLRMHALWISSRRRGVKSGGSSRSTKNIKREPICKYLWSNSKGVGHGAIYSII